MKQYAFTTPDPAVVLFDFAAAFPSVSQTFMWKVLLDLGLPVRWVNFLQLFYFNNFQQVGNSGRFSFQAFVGIRQ
eukprot:2989165-Prorocentrum_lima.AAC.1